MTAEGDPRDTSRRRDFADPAGAGFANRWRPKAPARSNSAEFGGDSQGALQPGNALPGDDPRSLAILAAWQNSKFRGWSSVEKRLDRARIVQKLLFQLREDGIAIDILVLAADHVACKQWTRLLSESIDSPSGWAVKTSDEILADEGRVQSSCLVVADELEAYLTADLAAAITGVRAILGLCGSPRGLSDEPRLRKHIGWSLHPESSRTALDFRPLAEIDERDAEQNEHDESDEVREQLITVKDPQNTFHDYLTKIQKVTLLDAEEEIELAKRIEAGLYAVQMVTELTERGESLSTAQRRDLQFVCRDGDRAKNRFIEANLRLVVSLAKRYSARMELMDAIQDGTLGLIRAVEKYDYTKGYKFSTYATWWIRQSIDRAIADRTHLIRLPVHVFESDAFILTELRRQSREQPNPPAAEIADALQVSLADVEMVLRRHQRPYSLDDLIEQSFDLIDADADTLIYEQSAFVLLQDQIQSVLETLSEREAGVIRLRFGLTDGEPRTLDAIGQVYDLTRERIRQIEEKTMSKLRHPDRSQVLRDYLD